MVDKILLCESCYIHLRSLESCAICGSRFGDRICPDCERSVCSSCIVYGKNICVKCNKVKPVPSKLLKKKYKIYPTVHRVLVFCIRTLPFSLYDGSRPVS